MAEVVRPDLLDVDPAEVSDYLLEAYGPGTDIQTARMSEGLHVVAKGKTTATMTAFLDALVPTSRPWTPDDAAYRSKLPQAIATHTAHLRDFRNAVRAGTQAGKTQAQRMSEMEHVVADVIDALRLLVDDRLDV